MKFTPADNLSFWLYSVFASLMFGLISILFYRLRLFWVLLLFTAVTVAGAVLAHYGVFQAFFIPLVPIFFVLLILMSIGFARTSPGLKVSQSLSFRVLVGFQAFRLPLELLLHHWVNIGVIPNTMTWTGQNLDIISGILALTVFAFAERSRVAVWIFQIIGFGLLLNVIRVVVLSMPFPFSWTLENPLQLALYFPYVLIGPLFVWPAMFGHAVLFRKLLASNDQNKL